MGITSLVGPHRGEYHARVVRLKEATGIVPSVLRVYNAEGRELVRQDLDKAAVQEAMSSLGNRISLRCEVIAESEPAFWTVWPYSAEGAG